MTIKFVKTLKIQVKLILNCPQAHAISYKKHKSYFPLANNLCSIAHLFSSLALS